MVLRSLQIMVGPVTSADDAVTGSSRRTEKGDGSRLWPIRVLAAAGCGLLLILLSGAAAKGNTIHVPAEQPTIQAAINAAADGDTVVVAAGTYKENIDFKGKAITVMSVSGAATAAATIIDGGKVDYVVKFVTSEGPASVLDGFTVTNGFPGGINIGGSAPTVQNSTITANSGCSGIGINIGGAAPLIKNNIISNNVQAGCSGGVGGGGIEVIGASNGAQIIGNTITGNNAGSGVNGGGIGLWTPGPVLIQDNFIRGNTASNGGGIGGANDTSGVRIIENVITGNMALGTGGGIEIDNTVSLVLGNTIAGNDAPGGGSAFYGAFFTTTGAMTFSNNIFVGKPAQSAVGCRAFDTASPPVFSFNDVFTSGGPNYGSICLDQTGKNGNISADPVFVNSAASDFYLQAGSPAIDAGSNAAPNLPAKDIAGNDRILNGDGDCIATIDMGAYEFARSSVLTFSTISVAFPDQEVGITSGPQPVTVSNTGSAAATVCGVISSGDFAQTNTCGSSIAAGTNCQINLAFTPTARGTRTGFVQVVTSDAGSPQTVIVSGKGVAPVANVSPTAFDFASQLIGVKSNPQTFNLSNTGDLALSISSISISGDFAQSNNCGTSVATGQSCAITATFTPTSSGTRAGSITINDNAAGTPHTVTLSGNGVDFSLGAASGGSTAATIVAGQTAIFNLQVAATGFVGTVNLACSGAPPVSTCTISPTSVNLNGNTGQAFSIGVATMSRSVIFPRIQLPRPVGTKPFSILVLLWLLMALLLILGGNAARKDGRGRLAIPAGAMLLLGILLTGCNGASSSTSMHGTPANTYAVTVTGTDVASGANRTLPLTLVVK
ncbi:MAG TPA: choice-of-anchor D domain-containing protein [Candidatus Acidoferrum sp.]|nr:choice-of-anchor D domain-containing protein [Candidatus Acidoferrum sp.]